MFAYWRDSDRLAGIRESEDKREFGSPLKISLREGRREDLLLYGGSPGRVVRNKLLRQRLRGRVPSDKSAPRLSSGRAQYR